MLLMQVLLMLVLLRHELHHHHHNLHQHCSKSMAGFLVISNDMLGDIISEPGKV
jgi:hypothetical protein